KEAKVTSLPLRQKSTGLVSSRLHGHNRLQSVMTETHAGNGGTKVVDQLLIDISTGDSSVLGSQAAARDNIQTLDSGKSVSRKKLTSETTMKTTTNRSANSTAKGQSTDVLKSLNELKDLQRQSLSSMNQMILTLTSAVKTFTQARTSRKRKRDEMSESESSDQEDLNDPGMAGNPPGDISSQVNIKRRELIKPDLNDQFKQLCGSHTPVTKLSFGDDLPKSVKEISETNKVGVKVSSKPPTHYNKQQKRSNYHHDTHHQSQKPFLWKCQGPGKRSHLDPKKKGKPNQH
ncbi:hypothetical protein P5673_022165, partial [Acropora cervicornis]